MSTASPVAAQTSPLAAKFLQYDRIDTSNRQDFKFVFSDANYTNKTILDVCIKCGDPSRSSYSDLILKNPTIRSINEHIKKMIPQIDGETTTIVNSLATNGRTVLPPIFAHYLDNIECAQIYNDEVYIDVAYPFTQAEVTALLAKNPTFTSDEIKKIQMVVKKFLCLTKIRIGGKSLDQWIDDAVACQTFIGANMKSVIEEIDPNYYPITPPTHTAQAARIDIEQVDHVINAKKKSYQATKYGTITMDSMGVPFKADLFTGTYLNSGGVGLTAPGLGSGQNADDFGTFFNVPGPQFNPLRNLIGFLFWDKSTFLSAVGHEIGHKLTGGIADPANPGKILRVLTLTNGHELETILQKNKLMAAYRSGLRTNGSDLVDSVGKKQAPEDIKGYFNEQIADIVGILLIERYVRSLTTPIEKLKAISFAQLWACGDGSGKNVVFNGHPPTSISRNILFLNRYLHDTYNEVSATTSIPSFCSGVIGSDKSYGGGKRKRTRKINRKNRKTMNRRRR